MANLVSSPGLLLASTMATRRAGRLSRAYRAKLLKAGLKDEHAWHQSAWKRMTHSVCGREEGICDAVASVTWMTLWGGAHGEEAASASDTRNREAILANMHNAVAHLRCMRARKRAKTLQKVVQGATEEGAGLWEECL